MLVNQEHTLFNLLFLLCFLFFYMILDPTAVLLSVLHIQPPN